MDKILLALAEFRTEMKNFFSSAATVGATALAEVKAQLATANETIAARDATIKELQGTNATAITAKDGEIVTLKAAVETEQKKANAVIAGQGLSAEDLPEAAVDDKPGTKAESAWNKYHRLQATDARAAGVFYAANTDAIYASRPK